MQVKNQIKIDISGSGQRLDQFLSVSFPEQTRSFFTKLIKSAHIDVNGLKVKPGYILQVDDIVKIRYEETPSTLEPAEIQLDIVFEDEDIIVVNKQAGLTVHPGKGTESDTLVNALIHHTQNLALKGSSDRPGIVHRLDKYTSGLMVVAKTDQAHARLRRQFDTKTISRTYWALVWGLPKEHDGTIHTFIDRSRKDPTRMAVTRKGREAITHWEILKEYNYFTLLKLNLETGRTHQIRLHMNWLGNPVLGDSDYNGRSSQLARLPANLRKRGQHLLNLIPRQFLHAKELRFLHPKTEKLVSFECPLPDDLQTALNKIPDLFLMDTTNL